MSIRADIQSLSGSAVIELFELDTTRFPTGGVFRFHAGTNALDQMVIWQGNTYFPFPIKCEGFEMRTQGSLPRPTLTASNVDGLIGSLANEGMGILGCQVTRIRTLARFLDAANFPAGNPTADATQELPREIWIVDRKASENKDQISFELCVPYDLMGQQLPARQVIKNTCV